jgi:hypothetical protein
MNDGMFEASKTRNFRNADILHFITETPLSHMQELPIESDKRYKYVRYRKSRGFLSLGELQVSDKQGNRVK